MLFERKKLYYTLEVSLVTGLTSKERREIAVKLRDKLKLVDTFDLNITGVEAREVDWREKRFRGTTKKERDNG